MDMKLTLFIALGDEVGCADALKILEGALPKEDFAEMVVFDCTETMAKRWFVELPAVKVNGRPYYGHQGIRFLAENYQSQKSWLQEVRAEKAIS